jgi:hypothetical protein
MVLAGILHSVPLWARPEVTGYYPQQIYPGVNVITVTNSQGIDRIVARGGRHTAIDVPTISGCPTKVDVRVTVGSATTSENVEFTVFDCQGGFSSQTLESREKWTILHEKTGNVEVGRDTCLLCKVQSPDGKLIDSIVVSDPRFSVRMPSASGPWRVQGGVDFNYQVCYHAARIDTSTEIVRIYLHRDYANGGFSQYVIEKPVTAIGAPPLPPPPKVVKRTSQPPPLPPLEDPTTFRNIVMPTAESLARGKWFVGTYDLAGWLAGYGVTDRLMLMGGGAAVPDFISRVVVGTIGAKYDLVNVDISGTDQFMVAAGYQYGYSSTVQSNISASTPFAVLSLGDRSRRLSVAAGYTWKVHTTPSETFNRNAYVIAIGGDYTIARGWKLAAETYVIESSGVAPLAVTLRYFTDKFAFDAGLGLDLNNTITVKGTSSLAGEIDNFRVAPLLSAVWRF